MACRTAWSKSGSRDASKRCEAVLNHMLSTLEEGRRNIAPNTISFNIVINALAKNHESGSEERAESLLEKMDEISKQYIELRSRCKPDVVVSEVLPR